MLQKMLLGNLVFNPLSDLQYNPLTSKWLGKEKDPGIPAMFPYKEQILQEVQTARLKVQFHFVL